MACLMALLLLCAVSFLGGRALLYGIYKTESEPCAAMVTGSVVLFFYMLMWQIVTVKWGLSFSVMKRAGLIYAVVMILAGLCVQCLRVAARLKKRKALTGAARAERGRVLLIVGIALVFALNVVSIQIYEPYFGSNMTLEEAGTILDTNTVCRYHPATGMELTLGMNAIAKLNCVPGLYAMLCAWTGADVYEFVCYYVPVWGLFLNYAAAALLLGQLFGKKDGKKLLLCGMLIYGMLLLMGDYQVHTYAFGLLHEGWKPGVILGATGGMVVLNVLVALVRLILARKERRAMEHAECME